MGQGAWALPDASLQTSTLRHSLPTTRTLLPACHTNLPNSHLLGTCSWQEDDSMPCGWAWGRCGQQTGCATGNTACQPCTWGRTDMGRQQAPRLPPSCLSGASSEHVEGLAYTLLQLPPPTAQLRWAHDTRTKSAPCLKERKGFKKTEQEDMDGGHHCKSMGQEGALSPFLVVGHLRAPLPHHLGHTTRYHAPAAAWRAAARRLRSGGRADDMTGRYSRARGLAPRYGSSHSPQTWGQEEKGRHFSPAFRYPGSPTWGDLFEDREKHSSCSTPCLLCHPQLSLAITIQLNRRDGAPTDIQADAFMAGHGAFFAPLRPAPPAFCLSSQAHPQVTACRRAALPAALPSHRLLLLGRHGSISVPGTQHGACWAGDFTPSGAPSSAYARGASCALRHAAHACHLPDLPHSLHDSPPPSVLFYRALYIAWA